MDIVTLALAKNYARLVGMGISDISISGTTVTFTLNNGNTETMTFPEPADGISIVDVDIDANNHFICTLSNNTTIDAGQIKTVQGPAGRGISSITKKSTSGLVDTYSVNYTDNTTSDFQVTNGANATVNGYNSVYIVAGDGITLAQDGNRIIISTSSTPSIDGQFYTSLNEILLTSTSDIFITHVGND